MDTRSFTGWIAGATVAAALCAPALARADGVRTDLEATTFAWGQGADAVAYPGGRLALSLWLGRLGLLVEGSDQIYGDGSMTSHGVDARFELGELPTGPPDTQLLAWAELGAARESWRFDQPTGESTALRRRRINAGGGLSYISPVAAPFHIGASIWLRGQFAEKPQSSTVARRSQSAPRQGPGRRAVVFGAGFLCGW